MISFDFKPGKFASAAAYLAERRAGTTQKHICKLLYFADKEHLLRYGRTITGDSYRALEQGPAPSHGFEALNKRGEKANTKVLSKSDIKVLDGIVAKLGKLKTCDLEELALKEPAWIKTDRNARMDFLLFFEGHPEAEAIKSILTEEEQPHPRALVFN